MRQILQVATRTLQYFSSSKVSSRRISLDSLASGTETCGAYVYVTYYLMFSPLLLKKGITFFSVSVSLSVYLEDYFKKLLMDLDEVFVEVCGVYAMHA